LPEPERPVTTVKALWGMRTVMFLRLCSRAPSTRMESVDMGIRFLSGGTGGEDSTGGNCVARGAGKR